MTDTIKEEWIELIDPSSNRKYYANVKTGVTSWTKPSELGGTTAAVPANQKGSDGAKESDVSEPDKGTTGTSTKPKKHGRWKQCFDENSGRHYFYHTKTRETTWDIPDQLREDVQRLAPQTRPSTDTPRSDNSGSNVDGGDSAADNASVSEMTEDSQLIESSVATQADTSATASTATATATTKTKRMPMMILSSSRRTHLSSAATSTAVPMFPENIEEEDMDEQERIHARQQSGWAHGDDDDLTALMEPTIQTHISDDEMGSGDSGLGLGFDEDSDNERLDLGGLDLNLELDDDQGYDFSSDSDFESLSPARPNLATSLRVPKDEKLLDLLAHSEDSEQKETEELMPFMQKVRATRQRLPLFKTPEPDDKPSRPFALHELDPAYFSEAEVLPIEKYDGDYGIDMEKLKQESELFPFVEFAEAHFQVHKSYFKKTSLSRLIKHQKSSLKHPLLNLTGAEASAAIQCFRNITGYMGDRKSSKDWLGHCTKLLRNAFKGPESLREEILCQLIKQTTENPDPSSERLGWKLLLICCSCFGPGEELACYLRSYIYRTYQNHQSDDAGIGKLALSAAKALERTLTQGTRECIPLAKEIAAIQNVRLCPLKISLLHGASISIAVGPQTTAAQVLDGVCEELNVPNDGSMCIAELMNLPGFQRFSPLPDNLRIMDLVTTWPEREQALTEASANSPDGGSLIRLMFKVKLFHREKIDDPTTSESTLAMLFLEAVNSVHQRLHKMVETDHIVLAALQLMGSYDLQKSPGTVSSAILKHLHEIVPSYLHMEQMETTLLDSILSAIKKIGIISIEKARKRYFEYLEHLVTFGTSFFVVNRITHTKKGHKETTKAMLGLSQRGILLINASSGEVEHGFTVSELLTYGIKEDNVLMVVGTSLKHRRLQFKSDQCQVLDTLIRNYFKHSPAVSQLGIN